MHCVASLPSTGYFEVIGIGHHVDDGSTVVAMLWSSLTPEAGY
jgi:hypothetical protein